MVKVYVREVTLIILSLSDFQQVLIIVKKLLIINLRTNIFFSTSFISLSLSKIAM